MSANKCREGPVLLITGPVGVGQTTIALQARELLREPQIPHMVVDLTATSEGSRRAHVSEPEPLVRVLMCEEFGAGYKMEP